VRRGVFEDLVAGLAPRAGKYEEQVFRECLGKGKPQMGAISYHPGRIELEFIYKNPNGAPLILVVTLAPPERLVFMPVPEWVIQSIWQGEISGSYHFESEAKTLLEGFQKMMDPVANAPLFNPSELGVKG